MLTCSSECFTVCFTSITGQFLIFELRGDSCLEGLSIATSKSIRDSLLLMVLVLTGVSIIVRQLLERNVFFYLVQFQLKQA